MLLTYKENVHSTQMYIPLKPLFSRHKGIGVQFTDEATSNLDVVSEAEVTGAMDELMRDKTTIMIAHNYAATRNADYIIVMKDGAVEAAGTPDELLKTNEYYKMFVKTL